MGCLKIIGGFVLGFIAAVALGWTVIMILGAWLGS